MPTEAQLEPTPNPISLKAALDRMRPLLESLPPTKVGEAGIDAARAATVVLGSLPRIEKHRPALEAQFGEHASVHLDELPVIACATRQADIELTAADSASDLSERFAPLTADHQLLLTDADALANRGLLDRGRVDAGRSSQGYRTTVLSTLVLIALLRERWEDVEDVTPLTTGELDACESRAQAMLGLLDEREQGSTRLPAVELRERALNRLIRTYGEVRRMLTYLRWWEDDADAIAPSPWAGRRKSRKKVVEKPVEKGVAPVVISPEPPVLPPPADPTDGGPFTD